MNGIIKIHARPKLRNPNLLAAWPGIGNVAMIIANYLKAKLPFKDLGFLEASYFFDPIGVLVKDNLVEAPTFPQSQFYYWKNDKDGNDLILFIGDDQPTAKGYELAHCVLDVGEKFGAERVYTCAAAITRIHHTEPPKVWGVATSHLVTTDLGKYNLEYSSNLQIAGLNGLLLGVAKEREIDGTGRAEGTDQHAGDKNRPRRDGEDGRRGRRENQAGGGAGNGRIYRLLHRAYLGTRRGRRRRRRLTYKSHFL
jgi:proteasome assembly chaperone (PAC2) family protein